MSSVEPTEIERQLEWECVGTPIEFRHVELPTPPFTSGTTTVAISRGRDLQLRIDVGGVTTEARTLFEASREEGPPAGTFLPSQEVVIPIGDDEVHLRMHLPPFPTEYHGGETDGRVGFKANGPVWLYKQRHAMKRMTGSGDPELVPLGPVAWLSDWYVNGFEGVRHFEATTKRSRKTGLGRSRSFGSISLDHEPSGGGSLDHLVVAVGDLRFAVCRVPNYFAPRGTRPMGIEYRGTIPPSEKREAVAELVSFLAGRRLMRVGSTSYDESGWTIEEEAVNPWARGLDALCEEPDLPPTALSHPGSNLSDVVVALLPKYLEEREPMGLNNALWLYWIAKEAPPFLNLPLFAAAVEALKKGYQEGGASKLPGTYVEKAEFKRLAGDLVNDFAGRAAKAKWPAAIINKIRGANQLAVGDSLAAFLEAIGLRIGTLETAAIKARNRPAHGEFQPQEEMTAVIRLGTAYRTLFERAFLRLLGYQGRYVDRTTLGFSERELGDPAGE